MHSSLDTNIILRYLRGDVPRQCQKVYKLLGDESQIFYVSDLVLAEVVFNLQAHDAPRESIVAALQRFCSLPNIMINPMIIDKVLPFYLEHPALSFVDCYAAFEADENNAEPLWTFDQKLARQHPSAKNLDRY